MSLHAVFLARQGQLDAPSKAAGLSADDPFASGRRIAFQDEAGFSAGSVELPMLASSFTMPHAEVIVMLSGYLVITVGDRSHQLDAGQAVALPKGLSGKFATTAGTRFVFNAMTAAGEAEQGCDVILLDPAQPRNPSAGPAPEVLVSPKPTCHSLNVFTDSSGMRAGVWDVMTPCERTFVPHRVHELMHILEGEFTFQHRDGETLSIKAGDSLFVPRGAPYAWINDKPVVKYYVVL